MMQEQLPEDLVRVDLLFRKAHESGIIIQVKLFGQNVSTCSCLQKKVLAIFCSVSLLEIRGQFFYPEMLPRHDLLV